MCLGFILYMVVVLVLICVAVFAVIMLAKWADPDGDYWGC